MNMRISDAGIGIQLLVEKANRWVNGNSFESLKMWYNNIFNSFNNTIVGQAMDEIILEI